MALAFSMQAEISTTINKTLDYEKNLYSFFSPRCCN